MKTEKIPHNYTPGYGGYDRNMNLEAEILEEHSRHQSDRIAAWIGSDRKRFAALMKLFLKGDWCLTQRSAWIVSICAERDPSLIR
ncbi:MAG TPA: hypothetical protein VEO56_17135, partial [Bacteroidota bacterium]|nr:hypothetical protein [Bacteroidota bacterium]